MRDASLLSSHGTFLMLLFINSVLKIVFSSTKKGRWCPNGDCAQPSTTLNRFDALHPHPPKTVTSFSFLILSYQALEIFWRVCFLVANICTCICKSLQNCSHAKASKFLGTPLLAASFSIPLSDASFHLNTRCQVQLHCSWISHVAPWGFFWR